MTKKHFTELARVLKNMKPMREREPTDLIFYCKVSMWENTVREMASFCSNYNPYFSRYRFLTACGVDEGE